MIVHIFDGISCDNHILARFQFCFMKLIKSADAPFDLISFYRIAETFRYADAKSQVRDFSIVFQIDNKLPVGKRFTSFKNEFKIFFFFNSISLFHHYYALSYLWLIIILKSTCFIKHPTLAQKKRSSSSDDLSVMQKELFFLFFYDGQALCGRF